MGNGYEMDHRIIETTKPVNAPPAINQVELIL